MLIFKLFNILTYLLLLCNNYILYPSFSYFSLKSLIRAQNIFSVYFGKFFSFSQIIQYLILFLIVFSQTGQLHEE